MSNLLPISDVKKIMTEYRMRLTTTALLLLALVLFIAAVLLAPTYLLASHKHDLVQTELSKSSDQGASDQERKQLQNTIRQAQAAVELLGVDNQKLSVSDDVLRKISSYGASGITIIGIFYDAKDATQTISLRGTALTRQNLTDFADMLKRDRSFIDVSLPISDLVKDKDINFTIAIKISGGVAAASGNTKQ